MAQTSLEKNTAQLPTSSFIGLFLTLIRAPLPTRIWWTIGTSSYMYMSPAFPSSNSKSSSACDVESWFRNNEWSVRILGIKKNQFQHKYSQLKFGWLLIIIPTVQSEHWQFLATSSKKASGSNFLVAALFFRFCVFLSYPHTHFLVRMPFFLSLKKVDKKTEPNLEWERQHLHMCLNG